MKDTIEAIGNAIVIMAGVGVILFLLLAIIWGFAKIGSKIVGDDI